MLFTDFKLGNGPAEDVEAEHDLEFQFALLQDDQSRGSATNRIGGGHAPPPIFREKQ